MAKITCPECNGRGGHTSSGDGWEEWDECWSGSMKAAVVSDGGYFALILVIYSAVVAALSLGSVLAVLLSLNWLSQ